MNWLTPRILWLMVSTLLGTWLGGLLGQGVNLPRIGMTLGAVTAAAMLAVYDTTQGYRFLAWLKRHKERDPIGLPGLWGEIEQRGLRLRTELRRQKEDAQWRLDQFLAAMEAALNGVMLLDDQQAIVWINAVAAEQFGLDPNRDLQQRITHLVRQPTFVAHLQAGQYDEPVLMTQPARNNATLSVQICNYGKGMRLVLSFDVSERERADAMRRDFVANVPHEIRTPLTVLAGSVETLEDLTLNAQDRRTVVSLLTQQTQRMQHLVDDLLVLAKLEGSPPPDLFHRVPVKDLLNALVADAKALSAGRHVLVLPEAGSCVADGVEIIGARHELLSAMGNLLSNAIRYTPDGGRVELRWQLLPEQGGGEFAVLDTGPGIAADHLPRLTERFYRVDSSRSRATGGTGLGLSIVKHVTQRHGAELRIISEAGKGSCFAIVFPASRVKMAPLSIAGSMS